LHKERHLSCVVVNHLATAELTNSTSSFVRTVSPARAIFQPR